MKPVGELEPKRLLIEGFAGALVLDVEHDVIQRGGLDVLMRERIVDRLNACHQLHEKAVWVSQPQCALDSRLQVGGRWRDDLHAARQQFLVRAIDVFHRRNLQRDVVKTRGVALAERQDVVVRPIGAKEHLAAELIHAFEPPAIVVELGLVAQASGLQANVRESGYLHHRIRILLWLRTVRERSGRPTFPVVMQACSPPMGPRIATRHAGIRTWNARGGPTTGTLFSYGGNSSDVVSSGSPTAHHFGHGPARPRASACAA